MKSFPQVAILLLLFLGSITSNASRAVIESSVIVARDAVPLRFAGNKRSGDSPPRRAPPGLNVQGRFSHTLPPEYGQPLSPSASESPTPPDTPSPRFTPSPPDLITFSSSDKSKHPSPARGHHRKISSGLFAHPNPISSPPKRPPPTLPDGNRHRLVSHSEPLPRTALPKKPGMLKKIQNVITGKSKPKLSKMFGSGKSPTLSKMFGSGRSSGRFGLSRTSSQRSRWSNHL